MSDVYIYINSFFLHPIILKYLFVSSKEVNYTDCLKVGTMQCLLNNNRGRGCRNILLREGIMEPRINELHSLKLNPNRTEENGFYSMLNEHNFER